jgi:hypothetical protein
MQHLPHRFTETAFRKYEKIIARIAENFPALTTINPRDLGLSPETVRGRLRDACTSLKEHGWITCVNTIKFSQIDLKVMVVSIKPEGMVVVGDKNTIKGEVKFEQFNVVSEVEILDLTPVKALTNNQLLCFLASQNALKKQLRLNLDPIEFTVLNENYDIVLTPQQELNTYLLS